MNTGARGMMVTALAVFGVSFLLPAYRDASGWGCFLFCVDEIAAYDAGNFGHGLYYPAFVLANVVFVAVALAGLLNPALVKSGLEATMWLATGQVLSWPVINLARADGDFRGIEVGYYVWLAAYAGLAVAVRRLRVKREEPVTMLKEITL